MIKEKISERLSGALTPAGLATWARVQWQQIQRGAPVESGQRDMNKIMSVHALSRLPEPADIADAIAFLASDQAKSITGILLPIDAGWLAGVSYRTYAGGVPWKE